MRLLTEIYEYLADVAGKFLKLPALPGSFQASKINFLAIKFMFFLLLGIFVFIIKKIDDGVVILYITNLKNIFGFN